MRSQGPQALLFFPENRLDRTLQQLAYPRVHILDELGYLPLTREKASLFFRLLVRRYERASPEGGTRRHASQPIRNRVLLTSRWCLHPSIHVRDCPTFTPPDVTCGLTRLRQRGPKGLPTAASAKLFLPRRARGHAGFSDEGRPLGASGSAWSVADRLTTKATCAHGQPLLGSVEHPAVHD